MKKILIIGAGRSASSLINYLLDKSKEYDWRVIVADMSLELAQAKIEGQANGEAVQLNAIEDTVGRAELIQKVDLVVSMLPPHLHGHIAEDCLRFSKHLATASYVSEELRGMDERARENGLTFLCEMGLDPGIDHMSAMQLIDEFRDKGAKIQAFRSYAGGLVAPESDDNPWHYKFTWSPRNVVLAGQGIATYLHRDKYRHVPYHRLFAESELVEVQGMGTYDAYPNRASLTYREAYGLEDIPTIMRGTLRHKGYCRAWNMLVQIGLTDDSYVMKYSEDLTYRQWLKSYLPPKKSGVEDSDLRQQLADFFGIKPDDEDILKLEWIGLWSEERIELEDATPAQVLQDLLERKWTLKETDKDMIIMQHELEYYLGGKRCKHLSTLVQLGKNSSDTAMANLVGLPLAIGVKNVLLGNIVNKGVHIPIRPEIYEPVMKELEEYGVVFKGTDVEMV